MKKILFLLPILFLPLHFSTAASTSPQLQAREQRIKLLESEIDTLDNRIEERIDLIVAKLTGLVDSKESRSQVAQVKKQTITQLENAIKNCQSRRAALVEEIRNPRLNLTLEQKEKAISLFDTRVEKRVDQIIALQKSFPDADETGKYNTPNTRYNSAYFDSKAQQSQNKRLAQQSDSLRAKVTAALKESIDRLESQNRTLQTKVTTATQDIRPLLEKEIARNEALIAERKKQLAQSFEGTATNARAVTKNEAADLNKLLADADKDLRTDVNALFQRYSEYLPALSDLNTARASAQSQQQ